MSPGRRARSSQLGNLYDDVLGPPGGSGGLLPASGGQVCRDPRRGERRHDAGTISPIRLRKLRRLDEARQEIRRAIECNAQFGHASEPWKTWAILADIETDAGNPTAAAEAKRKAIACYLAYRRDGGENHDAIRAASVLAVTQSLLAGDPAAAASLLQQLAARSRSRLAPAASSDALQAIVAGSRDRALADAPDLDYDDGRGNPLPDRDAGEARVAPAPRAGSSTKSPPADRRRLSLMRSPALAYLDMACL